MKKVFIDGENLTISEVVAVARQYVPVELAMPAYEKIEKSHKWIETIIARGEPVYGINTGFGIFAEQPIPAEQSAQLSRNLILSHAVGTGAPLDEEIVRAAMLVRANSLAKGFSGVRPIIIETLLELLNKNLTPVVPSQGSLGSSGDLAPLAQVGLIITTDDKDLECDSGFAKFDGEILTGKAAMEKAGIDRIILAEKEGLAFTNGASFTAAIGALSIFDAEILMRAGELSLALSLEALLGCSDAFDERLHWARGFQGQLRVAKEVLRLLKGSTLLDMGGHVQDAYSLRCAPQIHGFGWETLEFVKKAIETEINAATDNPLLFEPGVALSGGNFHGEPVGLALDYLGIALAELSAVSERRTYRLTDGNHNAGLPAMLVDNEKAAGLNSGLMMPQYTAASLVLENKSLANPDSLHSLPTSALQEDHNANAMTAARHIREIVANTAHVLAIECYSAVRALDLRLRQFPAAKLGEGTGKAFTKIREKVPYQAGDAWWAPEIEHVKALILNKTLEI